MEKIHDRMRQAAQMRRQIQAQDRPRSEKNTPPHTVSGSVSATALRLKLSWLAGGTLIGGLIVYMAWQPAPERLPQDTQPGYSATDTDIDEAARNISRLNEKVEALMLSVTDLDRQLAGIRTGVRAVADRQHASTSGSASQDDHRPAATQALAALPSPAAGNAAIKTSTTGPTATQQQTAAAGSSWVIHLASLQNRTDAEKFADGLRSKGIAAAIQQATVRDSATWRVFVPGFASSGEAGTEAARLRRALGIQSAWVARQ